MSLLLKTHSESPNDEADRISAKEFLLNLNPDFVHPPFGPIQPVLKVPDLRLKFPYPLFGGSELVSQTVSGFRRPSGSLPPNGLSSGLPSFQWSLQLPPLLAGVRLNPLENEIMNFAPLPKAASQSS